MAYIVAAFAIPVVDYYISNTFSKRVRSSENDQWKLAIKKEVKSLNKIILKNSWSYLKD